MDALMSVPAIADSRHADTNLAPAWLIGPLFRTTVIAFAVFLFLAAAVLWSRRAVGAITTPLPPSALLAVGLVVVSTALAARYTWRLTCPPRTATLTVFPLLTVSVLAFAAATSLPGSAPIALVGLWFLIVGEELWTWWPRRPHDPPPVPDASPRPARRALTFDSRQRFEQAVADSSLGVELAQEHVTQQVTRVVEPDGTERGRGLDASHLPTGPAPCKRTSRLLPTLRTIPRGVPRTPRRAPSTHQTRPGLPLRCTFRPQARRTRRRSHPRPPPSRRRGPQPRTARNRLAGGHMQPFV